jgi:hypothetical protein
MDLSGIGEFLTNKPAAVDETPVKEKTEPEQDIDGESDFKKAADTYKPALNSNRKKKTSTAANTTANISETNNGSISESNRTAVINEMFGNIKGGKEQKKTHSFYLTDRVWNELVRTANEKEIHISNVLEQLLKQLFFNEV